MNNNSVMAWLIPAHAAGATIALFLGVFNLRQRPKGSRQHRVVGRVWIVAMYWTVLSSFAIKELRPGHFSWIHGLSLFTFGTLSIALWAALTHRVQLHRRFVTGSYLGLLGAFAGAVVVPQRNIPQWAIHQPLRLTLAAAGCFAVAAAVVALSRRRGRPAPPAPGSSTPASSGSVSYTPSPSPYS
jgi:uncharacterized membrane protein